MGVGFGVPTGIGVGVGGGAVGHPCSGQHGPDPVHVTMPVGGVGVAKPTAAVRTLRRIGILPKLRDVNDGACTALRRVASGSRLFVKCGGGVGNTRFSAMPLRTSGVTRTWLRLY